MLVEKGRPAMRQEEKEEHAYYRRSWKAKGCYSRKGKPTVTTVKGTSKGCRRKNGKGNRKRKG